MAIYLHIFYNLQWKFQKQNYLIGQQIFPTVCYLTCFYYYLMLHMGTDINFCNFCYEVGFLNWYCLCHIIIVLLNTHVIIAFINISLYSCVTYRQVKEMVTLHLFIESHYKYIVLSIRERHILTLHLSTANWRIKLTTGCCCNNVAAHYVILPGRVNTTVPWVVAYYQCTLMEL